jgi:glyoxylase-like metal-dependent hydrolase (beta-lactamase superfamily II)
MKPATELNTINAALHGWAAFHPQWKIDFNSYVIVTGKGLVFVDPTTPSPSVINGIEALGEPLAVVLTNAHHARDADWFRKRYQIQIYAHEQATSDCDAKIDVLVMDGEKLPGGLKTIYLPGVTAGEMALFTKDGGGILLIGDAIIHTPAKGLHLLPEQYIEDKKQARLSLKKLLDLNFKVATFSHGEPLTGDAKKRIAAFLKRPKRS